MRSQVGNLGSPDAASGRRGQLRDGLLQERLVVLAEHRRRRQQHRDVADADGRWSSDGRYSVLNGMANAPMRVTATERHNPLRAGRQVDADTGSLGDPSGEELLGQPPRGCLDVTNVNRRSGTTT